jgi:tRNA-splicing ligase RtcB (3'-phosphate/5'-hydroxy nucleic acid ligase)
MVSAVEATGAELPDRELADAPIASEIGSRYLGGMRAAFNCALANREILNHVARRVVTHFFPGRAMSLFFDVSHTCKVEPHIVDGKKRTLFVHRKAQLAPSAPAMKACRPRFAQSANLC